MLIMPFTIKTHKFAYYSLNVAITLIEFFLGFRVLLKLLGANSSPFVNWIYSLSQGLLDPFHGMFDDYVTAGGKTLEFSVLFAIAFYALMYYFLVQLLILASDVVKKNNQTPSSKNVQRETNEQRTNQKT